MFNSNSELIGWLRFHSGRDKKVYRLYSYSLERRHAKEELYLAMRVILKTSVCPIHPSSICLNNKKKMYR
jgi:hypothetical protein